MEFQTAVNWQQIKKPTYDKGIVIIESDDGMEGDYTHWFPLFLKKKSQYLQWFPSSEITFVPNVNTAIIGQTGRQTAENLQELHSLDFEIMSHGRHHAGLGLYNLLSNCSAGATAIQVDAVNFGFDGSFEPYDYQISDGVNTDIFKVLSKSGNTLNITPALSNAYLSSVAKVELTPLSMSNLLQGALDDLHSWGVNAESHVYTFHTGSAHNYNQKAVDMVGEIFASGRGRTGDHNYPGDDIKLLKSRGLSDALPFATIDTILNETKNTDAVTIFYGHGEKTEAMGKLLEYIIDGCMTRGIKITSRKEGLKYLNR